MPKPGVDGRIYPPNNLILSLPIVWEWFTSAFPPIIWLWCTSEYRCPLEFGEKSVPFLVKTFFIFGLLLICLPEQNRARGSSSTMLKIGQNWGKIANYSPQCSTKIGNPGCSKIYFTTHWRNYSGPAPRGIGVAIMGGPGGPGPLQSKCYLW